MTSKAEALKPCPFCGGESFFYTAVDGVGLTVHCSNQECICSDNYWSHDDEDAADTHWNTRALTAQADGLNVEAQDCKSKMHIGIDWGNGRDFTSVALRIGEKCHIIPNPFARQIAELLNQAEKDRVMKVMAEALENIASVERPEFIGAPQYWMEKCIEEAQQALAEYRKIGGK